MSKNVNFIAKNQEIEKKSRAVGLRCRELSQKPKTAYFWPEKGLKKRFSGCDRVQQRKHEKSAGFLVQGIKGTGKCIGSGNQGDDGRDSKGGDVVCAEAEIG
jgi:hypothetical protein